MLTVKIWFFVRVFFILKKFVVCLGQFEAFLFHAGTFDEQSNY